MCLATIEAYFNVVYYNSLVEIIAQQRDNAERALMLARRQEELGLKGYADVVQMEAELSDREYELVTARNSLQSAQITLEDVMFYPVDSVLTIDMSVASLGDCSVESARMRACEGYGTTNMAWNAATDGASAGGYAAEAEADAIVARAKLFMPGVIQARGALSNAERNLSTAKWQFLPKLGLYSGWSTSYYTYPGVIGYVTTPYWEQFKNNSGEYLELSLTIPIYDRLAKHTKLARMRTEYRRADDSYKKALRDVESEVRRALQDRDGALAAMRQADRRAAAQQEAWKVNVKKYEQGLISGIEYNTAASAYLKAEAESLNAKLQYQLKRRVVDYYSGISYLDQK